MLSQGCEQHRAAVAVLVVPAPHHTRLVVPAPCQGATGIRVPFVEHLSPIKLKERKPVLWRPPFP